MEETTTIDVSENRVALYDPIKAGLTDLAERYQDGPMDLAVPENYDFCKSALSEMRKVRSKTEKLRKELKADALEYGRRVDSIAKSIIDQVLAIEEPYATAKKEYDTAAEIFKREQALHEERRVDAIGSRIAAISNLLAANISSSSAQIESAIQQLDADLASCGEWAMEFKDKAEATIIESRTKLKELFEMKLQSEQAAEAKAKADKEEAEKAEADRIRREAEEAAERKRLEEERKKLDEERAAIQAEKDKLAAERAEHERMQREREEAEKKAAEVAAEEQKPCPTPETNKEEPPAVGPPPTKPESQDQQAPTATSNGVTQDYRDSGNALLAITGNKATAKAVLDAIINGRIPNITFTGAL